MTEVASIYDKLLNHEALNRGPHPYPVHKNIEIDGLSLDGWILSRLNLTSEDKVLDAGCGTGNSLFKLWDEFRMKGLGISLSSEEVMFAQQASEKLGAEGFLEFRMLSYDDPLPGKFNLVLAIESLRHSEDPQDTIRNLQNSLAENGTILIAEDFVLHESGIARSHRNFWSSPGFLTLEHYLRTLEDLGFTNIEYTDLTNQILRRPGYYLRAMYAAYGLLKFLLPHKYRNFTTQQGALALEYLYAHGDAGYFVIIANKN